MAHQIFIRHKDFKIYMGTSEPTAENKALAAAEAEAAKPAKKTTKKSED